MSSVNLLEEKSRFLLQAFEKLEQDIRKYGSELKAFHLPFLGKHVEILDDCDPHRIGQKAIINEIVVIGHPIPRVVYKVSPINKKYLPKGQRYIGLRPNQVEVLKT